MAAASLRVGKTCKGVGKSWCLHDRVGAPPTKSELARRARAVAPPPWANRAPTETTASNFQRSTRRRLVSRREQRALPCHHAGL